MRYRRPQNYIEKLEHYKTQNIIVQDIKPGEPIFSNNQDIYLEIGMGRGAFVTQHAQRYPGNNYIGIEKQAPLLISASQKIEEMGLENIKLMSFDARSLEEVFGENTVAGIYLNFSDPWSKPRYAKRRLTHSLMLQKYAALMKDQSKLIIKTDNKDLFEFTIQQIESSKFDIIHMESSLYGSGDNLNQKDDPKYIQTEYESKFMEQGKAIFYLECKLNKV